MRTHSTSNSMEDRGFHNTLPSYSFWVSVNFHTSWVHWALYVWGTMEAAYEWSSREQWLAFTQHTSPLVSMEFTKTHMLKDDIINNFKILTAEDQTKCDTLLSFETAWLYRSHARESGDALRASDTPSLSGTSSTGTKPDSHVFPSPSLVFLNI